MRSPFVVPPVAWSAAAGGLARLLVHRLVADLPVRLRYPDGRCVGGGGPDSPVLEVLRPTQLYRRLERHPKIGLGEAYLAGDWCAASGTDLADALIPFATRLASPIPASLLALRTVVDRSLPAHQRNTPDGSRSNIAAHYDLSNELFAAFLDETMTYSSALFDSTLPLRAVPRRRPTPQGGRRTGLRRGARGTRVLEVGTGWGELAIRAARRGASVTSITLSSEQLNLARSRVAAAGVEHLVEVRLQDYRDLTGTFDAVVSIEMIEAVGEEFWADYLATLDRVLAPGGVVALQSILMDHDRFLVTRNSHGWIQEYIFLAASSPALPHCARRAHGIHR